MKTVLCTAALLLLFSPLANAVDITTSKMNNGRSGANLSETNLLPANVNVVQFGKLFERTVDGELYCQPLIVSNVVYLVTAKNVAYAFDASNPAASTPNWTNNFGNPVPQADVQCCCLDISAWVGTIGTPVIDSGYMYFVTKQKDGNGTYHHRLRKVNTADGTEATGSGLDLTATVGTNTFNAKLQNQRSGLLLQNGVLYIAFASHNDCGGYKGWIIACSAGGMTNVGAWMTAPAGLKGGIWMSGGGPVGDGTNIFFTTGNGDFNANSGGANYGQSFVNLSSNFTVNSYFTPANYATLNASDADLGSAGVLLIPGTRLLVSGGKDGKLYLVNADSMGGFNSGADACVQSFDLGAEHLHGGPVHWNSGNDYVYLGVEDGPLECLKLQGGVFDTTPVWTSSAPAALGMPGWQASISANSTSNGIVWTTRPYSGDANNAVQPGILQAFNALTGEELYNSYLNQTRDSFGNFAKNPSPVVADGKVYVPTFSGKLAVYGTNPPASRATMSPSMPLRGAAVTINYDAAGGPISGANPVKLHLGWNNWGTVASADLTMTYNAGASRWQYTTVVPPNASQLDCVFNNGGGTWDNNGGNDWHFLTIDPTASASDDACNYTGTGDWTGNNGGSGFSTWTSKNTGSSGGGFFRGTSTNNAAGANAASIDDACSGNFSWGLWAGGTSGNHYARVTRPFSSSLSTGKCFGIDMDNGWIENGGNQGFSLQNSSGNDVLSFDFLGGGCCYRVNGSSPSPTVGWTSTGLHINVTLTSSTNCTVSVTTLSSSVTTTYTNVALQNPAGGQTIDRVRFYANSSGSGSNYDLFFNNLSITTP